MTEVLSTIPESNSERFIIRVVGPDGDEIHFRIKPTTLLSRVKRVYCERLSVDQNAVRFLYDGQRIKSNATPADLGLENNDVIDAIMEQVGGSL